MKLTTARAGQLALALLFVLSPARLDAQARAAAPASPTASPQLPSGDGWELALAGSARGTYGQPYHVTGVAYRVSGLATLRSAPGARVRVQIVSSTLPQRTVAEQSVTADREGRFAATLALPDEAIAGPRLLVEVGERIVERALSIGSGVEIDLLTDRAMYEPGERLHVFARLRAVRSASPLRGRTVRIRVLTPSGEALATQTAQTRESGGVSAQVAIPRAAVDGMYPVEATLLGSASSASVSRAVRIGRRTVERLLADVELERAVVAPAGRLRGTVTVRAPSGAPVMGAVVRVHATESSPASELRTDEAGEAHFTALVPAFLAGDSAPATLVARVAHPAYGATATTAPYTIARVPWTVTAVAQGGVLVPELDAELYLAIGDVRGGAPPAGTSIEVAGAAVPNGRARATTDRHGFAVVTLRLPRGAAAQHRGAACAYRVAASLTVTVEAQPVATARVCVAVAPDAEVGIRADETAVPPASEVHFRIARRPSARGRPVLVEVLAQADSRAPAASVVVAASSDRGSVLLPADVTGPIELRARPWTAGAVSLGTGTSTFVLARPADAFVPRAEPGADVYRVRSEAAVRLATQPGARGWATLVARDLAAHGGEEDYALRWLSGALRDAVTSPSTPEADRLLRSALAALAGADPKAVEAPPLVYEPGHTGPGVYPESMAVVRGVLRDPFARREELLRRGIGGAMAALEWRVDRAGARLLPNDPALVERGGRRSFRPDALARLLNERQIARAQAETLGATLMSVAMLQAADSSFGFDAVARRVTRRRLVRTMVALGVYLDPQVTRGRPRGDPPERWLSRLVQHGMVSAETLVDAWGHPLQLRRSARPAVVVAVEAAGWEIVSAGPDGRVGTADDLRDPFARLVARATPYAVASGEDRLMTQLADLGPVSTGGLARMAAAFQAVTAQSSEELEADAITATVSEQADSSALGGLELDGADEGGGGTGSGSGYGRGGGRLASRRTRAPRIAAGTVALSEAPPTEAAADDREMQMPMARPAPMQPAAPPPPPPPPAPGPQGAMGQLATLVRERFPATLHVVAEVPLDATGTTTIPIPTADALTTYRVEAIVWTPSGWTWPARTAIRVDQELVVDAPVPPFVTTGDVLRIPVRASNRTASPIRTRLELVPERGVELRLAEPREVEVPPHDAVEVVLEARAGAPREGSVLIRASRAGRDEVLDAARRPLHVLAEARAVRERHDVLVAGAETVSFSVPAEASARGTSSLTLRVGGALFGDPATWWEGADDPSWAGWSLAASREVMPEPLRARLRDGVARSPEERRLAPDAPVYFDPSYSARALSALWADRAVADEDLRRLLERVATIVPEEAPGRPAAPVLRVSEIQIDGASRSVIEDAAPVDALLGLGPALRAARARPALGRDLRALVDRLRRAVSRDIARVSDAPAAWAHVAAALALTAVEPREARRARELLRRVERSVVLVGDRAWLEPDGELESATGHVGPTALLAIARRALGDPAGAARHVRALASIARSAPRWAARERALAATAAATLTAARLRGPAAVQLDGQVRRAPLEHGTATVELGTLGPGEHRLQVALPPGTIARAEVLVRYGLPWTARITRPAFEARIEGDVGARDTRAAFVLVVQNRGARLARQPIVEVDLPAGAELDEPTRALLAESLGTRPLLEGRTLRMQLRPLSPAGRVRIPLPVRWSVGGALRGLGVAVYEENDPSGTGVSMPRVVSVADRGTEPERPRLPRPGASPPPPPPPPPVPLPIDDLPVLSSLERPARGGAR